MNPVDYYKSEGWRVTSPFGPRGSGFHRGVDFGGRPCGAMVKTPYSGRVVAAETYGMGTWGNTVCIELDPDGQYISLSAHLETIEVKRGQHVNAGDVIGTNGGTNHSGADYPCHIHYEIQRNTGDKPWRGELIDPAKFNFIQEVSDVFKPGDIVFNKGTMSLRIREGAGTRYPTVGSIAPEEEAEIIHHAGNGLFVDGYHWWNIGRGWVAGNFLGLVIHDDPDENLKDRIAELEDALLQIRLIVQGVL